MWKTNGKSKKEASIHWLLGVTLLLSAALMACGVPIEDPTQGIPAKKQITPTTPTNTTTPTEATSSWKPAQAARVLEASANAWHQNGSARRSDGKTACLSCHTTFTYLLARPMLRQHTNALKTALETQLYKDIIWRVDQGDDVKPWYSSSPEKIKQSHGSEVVLNFVALSFRDAYEGKTASSPETLKALAQMWARQQQDGAWAWLDFSLAPWENKRAAYWGAAMAAVALGKLPKGQDVMETYKEQRWRLQAYLTKPFFDSLDQNSEPMPLYDQAMLLWASTFDGDLIGAKGQQIILTRLLEKQRADGGWSLLELGPWPNGPQGNADQSDGYATGMLSYILFRLQQQSPDEQLRSSVDKGRRWLTKNQNEDGSWTAPSVNRNGSPTAFMKDAATAFAVMALTVESF